MISSMIRSRASAPGAIWRVISFASLSYAASQTTYNDGKDSNNNKKEWGDFSSWFGGASPNGKGNKNNNIEFSDRFKLFLAEAQSHPAVVGMLDAGIPSQVGFGFVMGYSSGFCLKKVSKVVAFVAGGSFILLQSLSYSRYIDVNYKALQKDAEKIMDLNGDGKIDGKDFEHAFNKINKVLGHQMPSGGGFAAGLLLGLRS